MSKKEPSFESTVTLWLLSPIFIWFGLELLFQIAVLGPRIFFLAFGLGLVFLALFFADIAYVALVGGIVGYVVFRCFR